MSLPLEILDTDLLSEYLRQNRTAVAYFRTTPPESYRTTVINEIELLGGRFQAFQAADTVERLLAAQQRLDLTREFLAVAFPVIFKVDLRVGEIFFDLTHLRGLKKIGRRDLLIAAIALRHEATLVTGNIQHFSKVPRLKVKNWRT